MALKRSVQERLLDLHGGQAHLARRQLAFLHHTSVADDPTRVIRAARYGARLGFSWLQKRLSRLGTRWWPGHGVGIR